MKAKDKKFMSLMYDHYADALYGIILRILKDEEAAKDVMKQSFLKVWRNVEYFEPEKSKLFTWLLQIFRTSAMDYQRKTQILNDRNIRNDQSIVKMVSNTEVISDLLNIYGGIIKSKLRQGHSFFRKIYGSLLLTITLSDLL